MNIFINTSKCFSMYVNADLLIENLKKLIEDKLFISSRQIKLYFKSEQLVDNLYISDYGICTGDTLQLNFDLLGGKGESSRYKKSTSKFRWKWKKKRTRRLQKKRRKMRMRAR